MFFHTHSFFCIYIHTCAVQRKIRSLRAKNAIGLGNKSGCMTADFLPNILQHIKSYTNCRVDNKILVLLGNHTSHISLYARENPIVLFNTSSTLLTRHTECNHRIQPNAQNLSPTHMTLPV